MIGGAAGSSSGIEVRFALISSQRERAVESRHVGQRAAGSDFETAVAVERLSSDSGRDLWL